MAATRRRNLLRLGTHFVWATHQRMPLITEDIERRLYRYIEAACKQKRCAVLALGGMPDHIHLFVALSSTVSVAELIKQVKGGSSRFVSETLTPGKWFAWQPNYAALAVSAREQDALIAYIRNQKRHHAANDLWLEMEQTDEEAPVNECEGESEA